VCVCVRKIVCDLETSNGSGLGPKWAVAPQKIGTLFNEKTF
jgi:hypothetical protein